MADYGVSHYGTGSYLRNVAEPLIGSQYELYGGASLSVWPMPKQEAFAKSALSEWPSLSNHQGVGRCSRLNFLYLLSRVRIS